MAIQPIDMQTMYSQLNNVAKNAGAQQQAQLSEAMQQQSNIQKNLENSQKIQNTSNTQSLSPKISSDGKGGANSSGTNFSSQKDDSDDLENQNEEAQINAISNYQDKKVGSIIDIMR